MSNLVPWKRNLPDTKKTKKKEKRALKKVKNAGNAPMSFDEAMNALKKVSGHVEYRIIPMRCGTHGKPFAVIFKRDASDTLYRIDKIVKEAPSSPEGGGDQTGVLARHFAGKSSAPSRYDFSEFDLTGGHCPWCGDREGTVACGKCNTTYCYGGVTKRESDGASVHKCPPPCGASGVLTSATTIKGTCARPKVKNRALTSKVNADRPSLPSKENSLTALKDSSKKALSPPGQMLLPGK